jgi:hypothetical protein
MAAKATSADPDHFSRRMREAMDVEPQLFHRTVGALQVTMKAASTHCMSLPLIDA